jgi:hypothetical protein
MGPPAIANHHAAPLVAAAWHPTAPTRTSRIRTMPLPRPAQSSSHPPHSATWRFPHQPRSCAVATCRGVAPCPSTSRATGHVRTPPPLVTRYKREAPTTCSGPRRLIFPLVSLPLPCAPLFSIAPSIPSLLMTPPSSCAGYRELLCLGGARGDDAAVGHPPEHRRATGNFPLSVS